MEDIQASLMGLCGVGGNNGALKLVIKTDGDNKIKLCFTHQCTLKVINS